MRSLALPLMLAGLWAEPALAQHEHHQHEHHQHQHHQHQHHQHHQQAPNHQPSHSHGHSHSHDVGPAGATYDLRWLDAMVQHHIGALRMSELVFNVGSPGVGALANGIWREQAREIKAMGQWRRVWYPQAPAYPVALKAGGDADAMSGLERMPAAQIEAMQMMGSLPSKDTRVQWFLEGMLAHHGGALEMAHDALAKSTNPTVRRLAREIILSQRQEILALRRMLQRDGLNKPDYYRYDALFSL
jgi:uncharacterized protein (DUF305 family)